MDVRTATAADAGFLRRMLAVAADWRPDATPRADDELLADPGLAHYVVGWPRGGDVGVVAEIDGRPVGAAWCRTFSADDPGYGFVAPNVPEAAIGVVADARGQGIGRTLMERLVQAARERGIERMSLSVEVDNPARHLYVSLGFVEVAEAKGSTTMCLDLG